MELEPVAALRPTAQRVRFATLVVLCHRAVLDVSCSYGGGSSAGMLGAQARPPEQCKDPLYQTHWAGKNDIQTLLAFPALRTNLKLCPAYNQRTSCCHQTFESEQHKYYSFALQRLHQQLARADLHRRAVAASVVATTLAAAATSHGVGNSAVASGVEPPAGGQWTQQDQEQVQVALARYEAMLAPSDDQSQCLSQLLTYVAGMVCFCCKPDWSRYVVLSGRAESGVAAAEPETPPEAQRVVRVRMARTVCNQIWSSCQHYGGRAAALASALRDSSIARQVPPTQENFAMFTSQEALCDWMHEEFALSPFRLPLKETGNVPALAQAMNLTQARVLASKVAVDAEAAVDPLRRLATAEQELDVLLEGRQSKFERAWQGTILPTSTAARSFVAASATALVWYVSIIAAVASVSKP